MRTILYWLVRLALRFRGPLTAELPEGARCAVPGCRAPATDQWFPGYCSLREAGVDLDWVPVCSLHDVKLNEMTVRFLFGARYEAELAAYRRSRLSVLFAHDPRISSDRDHRTATENPALIIAERLRQMFPDREMDWEVVARAADHCDEPITGDHQCSSTATAPRS